MTVLPGYPTVHFDFGALGALPGNQIEVTGMDVVDVSFPDFWERLAALRR